MFEMIHSGLAVLHITGHGLNKCNPLGVAAQGRCCVKRLILCLVVTALLVLALAVPALALKGGVPAVGIRRTPKAATILRRSLVFLPGNALGGCTSFFARYY